VGAYLAGDEIVKIAVEHGAQMIHPGECGEEGEDEEGSPSNDDD
jgi:pyruvate carboxylase